ncbi:MAG TPA: radical SAM protein [Flavobacteriales bacterium]|nr:radical SAM protein [Flavobacteriales bacterium]
MKTRVLLITPPFTQLNTPYPATAYLKGFLNTQGIFSHQCDLGIDTILKIFSKKGLSTVFQKAQGAKLSQNTQRILNLQNEYIKTIDPVIHFLQGNNPTLAQLICERNFLPEASRFAQLDDLEWAFGTMGTQDKARHLATLYLEDIGDLIVEALDRHFGFSRYAERLGRSANTFDELHKELNKPASFIDAVTLELLEEKIKLVNPTLVAFSVPFPGNLYSGFKCAQYIKKNHPEIAIVLGGGFANTELRSVSDNRVFNYVDFISLDDGETPILNLIEHLEGKRERNELKRTFACENNEVVYFNGSKQKDFSQKEVGTPDYSDLPLKKYISVIEMANPMHRLWSDGRWNKLTLAHGCYWGKCTFCDISLDYIKRYEPSSAKLICDRIEEMIAQTGETGFHFVDEAAPPALMKELALEILRRKLVISWWTNIRFEKSFTNDLCVLLSESGCIAVSGGLEVASDRLLALIDKGVTVEQVTKVAANLTNAGIMVHAYLMHGFPTQTAQETIDSMEVVRQLFEEGVLQSGFWHRFAMTAHSPVGMNPQAFKVMHKMQTTPLFANNDLEYTDEVGCDHDAFCEGLKKSLFNYMHGICFEFPLQEWFDFKVPKTKIPKNYIAEIISAPEIKKIRADHKVVWLGTIPTTKKIIKNKKKKIELNFSGKKSDFTAVFDVAEGEWLLKMFPLLIQGTPEPVTIAALEKSFKESGLEHFEVVLHGKAFQVLRDSGLLIL